jgi:hypothetical protein
VHHCLRGEEDGRESDDQQQARHDGVPIPNGLADPTVQKQSDNFTYNNTVAQASLPSRRYFVSAVRKHLAVLAFELGKAKEIVEQTDVVPFHNDTSTDQNGPSNSFWVELDALKKGHIMLFLSSKARIVDDTIRGTLVVAIMVKFDRRSGRGLNILFFRHVDVDRGV